MAAVVQPTGPKALAEQMSRNILETLMNEWSTYGVVNRSGFLDSQLWDRPQPKTAAKWTNEEEET